MLGAEESNALLREQVTQQEDGLPILENTQLGKYLFYFCLMSWLFLSLVSEPVILLLELSGRVGSLERDLETAKVTIGRNAEALAKSLEG